MRATSPATARPKRLLPTAALLATPAAWGTDSKGGTGTPQRLHYEMSAASLSRVFLRAAAEPNSA